MAKKIFLKKTASEELRKGINLLADAVGSTLGAGGKPVIIASGYGHMPISTKDGVTVAKSFFIEDETQNAGAFLIRGAAEKTVKDCGDGTTTSTVLAQSIINQGLDTTAKEGVNSIEVKSGIEKGVAKIVEKLKEMSIEVNDSMITSVATISANNDVSIGEKIGEAYSKMGKGGMLSIENSRTGETYVEVVAGTEMIRGFGNEQFATNMEKMLVEYENPLILVADYEIKTVKELAPIMEQMHKSQIDFKVVPFIIIARGFEGEPHNTMLYSKVKGGLKFCLIEAPGAYQKEALVDVATVLGATLISEDNGIKVENADMSHLGTCKKFVSSRTSTTFVEGAGKRENVDALKRQIEKQITETDNMQLKEILEKRSARLSGSIGVIYVGGATDIEREERKHRVDDANRAVKSAIEEGVVAGGGVALIRCIKYLDDVVVMGDESIGISILKEVCMVPLKKMLDNAGLTKNIACSVFETDEINRGYNIKTKKFVDMIKENILDPTKVVRCALQNAASVSGQVITSDVLLVEQKPTS